MSAQPAMSRSSLLPAVQNLPPGSQLVIHDTDWADYEHLLDEIGNDYRVRVNYSDRRLIIMSLTQYHEMYCELLIRLVDLVADKLGLDFESRGSMTFKLENFAAGAEPDTCFYVQNARRIIGKRHLDLKTDPPPDVIVEIDLFHASHYKRDFYAQLRVPELWRYDEQRLEILHLVDGKYVEQPNSLAFPVLTADVLTQFLEQSKTDGQSVVRKAFRKWLKTAKA